MKAYMTGVTFGAIHAITLPPTHDGSLWSHISVIDFPGLPACVDEHCPPNTIYFVNEHGIKEELERQRKLAFRGDML